MNRIEVAVKTLKAYAAKNNLKAIEALIKMKINKEFYLDQLCEITENGSTGNKDLKDIDFSKIEDDERVRAATKIIALDEVKDTNVTKKEDLDIIEEAFGAELGKD